jgi:hypothetical protein
MSRESDAMLMQAIMTPPEEEVDAAKVIYDALLAAGLHHEIVDWHTKGEIVDRALKPYRDEIKRLRADPRDQTIAELRFQLNALRTVAEARENYLRSPAPCGKHPKACWVEPTAQMAIEQVGTDGPPDVVDGHCTVCREIAELRESLLVARLEEAQWWELLCQQPDSGYRQTAIEILSDV